MVHVIGIFLFAPCPAFGTGRIARVQRDNFLLSLYRNSKKQQ